MKPFLKRGLHLGGSILAIVGIIFVIIRLRSYSIEIDFSRFNMTLWFIVAGFVFIYALANILLALAWWNILVQFSLKTSRKWAIRVYGISQIAKYLPGNIFHLAGRQGMGMVAGLPGWPLAKSSVWELGLISVAGCFFGLLVVPLLVKSVAIIVAVLVFALMLCIAFVLIWRFIGISVARAFICHVSFLTISGILFVALVELLTKNPSAADLPWLPLCGAYVLAWLGGLVTPGAPAGVGVRELILLFLLKGIVGETDLLLSVVVGRMITVSGDLGFFGFVNLINKNVPLYCDRDELE